VKDGRNGGEPGLDDRLRAVLGEGHAEHELAAPDRLRKHTVPFRLRGGGSLRLGEEHVEHHGGGSRRGELVDQRGELDARPGPLPEPLQRLVVDRDDADRAFGIVDSRRPALEDVELEVAQRPDAERFPQ